MVLFASFYGYVFPKDGQAKFTQLHHVFLPQMVCFQVKGVSEARTATALQQLQTQHQVGRWVPPGWGWIHGEWGCWPPKKKPGKGGNSNVFEHGSPRKLFGEDDHPFWSILMNINFSKGVGEKPPTWKPPEIATFLLKSRNSWPKDSWDFSFSPLIF